MYYVSTCCSFQLFNKSFRGSSTALLGGFFTMVDFDVDEDGLIDCAKREKWEVNENSH